MASSREGIKKVFEKAWLPYDSPDTYSIHLSNQPQSEISNEISCVYSWKTNT